MVGRGTKPPLKPVSKSKVVKVNKKLAKVQRSLDSYHLVKVIAVNSMVEENVSLQGELICNDHDHDHDHDYEVDLEAYVSSDGTEWVDIDETSHTPSKPSTSGMSDMPQGGATRLWSQVTAPTWQHREQQQTPARD